MKRLFRLAAALGLAAAVALIHTRSAAAFQGDGAPASSGAAGKAPVQGYTRTNRKTGRPEQVKPYARRPPQPKPVQVQPYTRGDRPVAGHERRPPARPMNGTPDGKPKTQSGLLPWGGARRPIA